MRAQKVVSHEEWLAAREELLAREKELTRQRDAVTRARRELPWEKVEKSYEFDGPDGRETLADLFGRNSQLIVYHFMLGPGWDEGCPSCSFIADHFEPAVVHLNQRDVSMVAVSKAPYDEIAAFQNRMGWTFKWVSSHHTDFNEDYNVTFSQDQLDRGEAFYNYRRTTFPSTEAPGASVFAKIHDGGLYHTYSVYARGLDTFIAAYHYLDIVPKGRDEDGLSYTMEWLRLHDAYER